MKKLIALTFGMLFMFSNQAVPCTAVLNCDGEEISCHSDYKCEAGSNWVSCTWANGNVSTVRCGLGG